MTKQTVYEFDQCEAARADSTRCPSRGNHYVKNPGAPFPFLLCGTHKRSAERHIERDGGIPNTWGKFNFIRGPW